MVAGVDRYAVEDAAGPGDVDYEPLPAAIDVLNATREGGAARARRRTSATRFWSRRFQQGDVDVGAGLIGHRRGANVPHQPSVRRTDGGPRRRGRLERARAAS